MSPSSIAARISAESQQEIIRLGRMACTLPLNCMYILRRVEHLQRLAVFGEGCTLAMDFVGKGARCFHITIMCKVLRDELLY